MTADFEDQEADGDFEVDEDLPLFPSDAEFEAMPPAIRLRAYLILFMENRDAMSDAQREACAEDRRRVSAALGLRS